jgi:hypothetical protein
MKPCFVMTWPLLMVSWIALLANSLGAEVLPQPAYRGPLPQASAQPQYSPQVERSPYYVAVPQLTLLDRHSELGNVCVAPQAWGFLPEPYPVGSRCVVTDADGQRYDGLVLWLELRTPWVPLLVLNRF